MWHDALVVAILILASGLASDSTVAAHQEAFARLVVVPALYRKQLAQVPWLAEFETRLYQRTQPGREDYVPNRADEAAVFMKYLVDRYYHLPEVVAFLQDDAGPDTVGRLHCLRVGRDWGWTNLNEPASFFKNRRLDDFLGRANWVACYRRLAGDFQVPLPAAPVVNTYCCSEFAVTRNAVHRYSRAVYRSAYDTLVTSSECNPGGGGERGLGGWALEHLHHAIFGRSLAMEPLSMEEMCERFRPACNFSSCRA
jgi:hypothetical protein